MAEILGTFEQAVLLATLRLGKDAYGRAILREMGEALGRDVAAGAVYATLDRLEAKAYVTSRLGEGTTERGGRPRRYFRVTASGVRALNEAKTMMETLWRTVSWPIARVKDPSALVILSGAKDLRSS
jgi:PadR family transcriptional regulator, regulatory protein PadR